MHLPRALAAALLLSAVATPAAAATMEVPTQGFALTVAPPGARVCRIVPRDADGSPGCADLDLRAIEARIATQTQKAAGMALLRFPDATVVLTLVSLPRVHLVSQENLLAFFDGVRSSLPGKPPSHGDGGGAYDLLKLNGVDVARGSFRLDVPKGDPMYATASLRTYLFVGADGAVTATFTTDAEHGPSLAAAADAVASTAVMTHAGIEDFGESSSFFIGKAIGAGILPMGGLVVAIVLVLQRRRRAATARRAG